MAGITDLETLLESMDPQLHDEEYVFCTVSEKLSDYIHLQPLASFLEEEGLTLVLERRNAVLAKLPYEGVYRRITLTVHSSLDAVGLTAAISTKLSAKNISANVIAAYYHDHVFVPAHLAEEAILALGEFGG